jgi:hypothetical protein
VAYYLGGIDVRATRSNATSSLPIPIKHEVVDKPHIRFIDELDVTEERVVILGSAQGEPSLQTMQPPGQ